MNSYCHNNIQTYFNFFNNTTQQVSRALMTELPVLATKKWMINKKRCEINAGHLDYIINVTTDYLKYINKLFYSIIILYFGYVERK